MAVAGDLTIETTGAGVLDLTTAGGATAVAMTHPEARMQAVLPAGTFDAPVAFTITRLDPATLPAEGTVDPVAAYRFDFAVPTLDQDATLTFEVPLDELDPATRQALTEAVAAGRATLATRGDAARRHLTHVPGLRCGRHAERRRLRVGGRPPAARSYPVHRSHRPLSTWAVAIVASPSSLRPRRRRRHRTAGRRERRRPRSGPTQVKLALASRRIRKGRFEGPDRRRELVEVSGRLAARDTERVVKLRTKAFRAVPGTGRRRTVTLKLPEALRTRRAELRAAATPPRSPTRWATAGP